MFHSTFIIHWRPHSQSAQSILRAGTWKDFWELARATIYGQSRPRNEHEPGHLRQLPRLRPKRKRPHLSVITAHTQLTLTSQSRECLKTLEYKVALMETGYRKPLSSLATEDCPVIRKTLLNSAWSQDSIKRGQEREVGGGRMISWMSRRVWHRRAPRESKSSWRIQDPEIMCQAWFWHCNNLILGAHLDVRVENIIMPW